MPIQFSQAIVLHPITTPGVESRRTTPKLLSLRIDHTFSASLHHAPVVWYKFTRIPELMLTDPYSF